MAARGHDGLPRAAVTDDAKLRLAPSRRGLPGFLFCAGDDECLWLEHAQRNAVAAGRKVAVRAILDRLPGVFGRPIETMGIELAVNNDGHPPAGNGVPA